MDKQFFKSIPYEMNEPRKSSRENYEKNVVKFGDYNDFPNHLVDLYNNSSIHETCVNAIVEAIKGDGLVAEPSWVLDVCNREGESYNDLFSKIALDYYLFGGFYIEVIYNKLRNKPAEYYHVPFASVRAKKCNHRGKIEGYYIAHEWQPRGEYMTTAEDALYIPAYNAKRMVDEPSQLYAFKPYHPLQKYYPLPKYVGALKVIELDTEVDNWHVSNIKNGLTPSIAITTYTNGTEEDRRAIENQLRLQFQGSGNAGQMFYMDVDSRENKPDIEAIANNGGDTYYTTINDMVVQKILTAHRITSPMLLGIKTEGQLGGAQEMLDAYTLFLNMVIKPYQQDILSVLEELLEMKYPEFDIVLGVEQKQILDTGTAEVDVITSKEAESGEDVGLETDIKQEEIEQSL